MLCLRLLLRFSYCTYAVITQSLELNKLLSGSGSMDFPNLTHALFSFLAVTFCPNSFPTLLTVPPTALAPLPTAPAALPTPRLNFAPNGIWIV